MLISIQKYKKKKKKKREKVHKQYCNVLFLDKQALITGSLLHDIITK
jgi:hypothetical protein